MPRHGQHIPGLQTSPRSRHSPADFAPRPCRTMGSQRRPIRPYRLRLTALNPPPTCCRFGLVSCSLNSSFSLYFSIPCRPTKLNLSSRNLSPTGCLPRYLFERRLSSPLLPLFEFGEADLVELGLLSDDDLVRDRHGHGHLSPARGVQLGGLARVELESRHHHGPDPRKPPVSCGAPEGDPPWPRSPAWVSWSRAPPLWPAPPLRQTPGPADLRIASRPPPGASAGLPR
jgi:hypothetical protein